MLNRAVLNMVKKKKYNFMSFYYMTNDFKHC